MSKLSWGGELNTRILRMDLEDELGDSQDSGGSGGTTPTTQAPPANAVELNIYKVTGVNQQELVFSDYIDPTTGEFTISAEDVADWGDGNFKARVGGTYSNDFTVALAEMPPIPQPQGVVNAKHYRFTPQRSIVETVINEVVGIDNGKVDVPVQFNMNYSIYNVAPPGYDNPGSLQVLDQIAPPMPVPQADEVDVPRNVNPQPFNFPAWYGISGGERVGSEPRTIVGITEPVMATVRGDDAHIQRNGDQITKQPVQIREGDVIRLWTKRPRVGFDGLMPQADFDNTATLTIGNFTTTFRAFWGNEDYNSSTTTTGTGDGGSGDGWDYGGS
tara:strand:+ start:3313 stop:4302 length:990 start_codon:yes stop_codon:yes gene_type:complete